MTKSIPHEASLFTVAQMSEADRLAEASGQSEAALIEAAGRAIAEEVFAHFTPGSVLVMAGPGNNGSDGIVAARHLRALGWPVEVALHPQRDLARQPAWDGVAAALDAAAIDRGDIIIDALFGAGLSRPLDPATSALVDKLAKRRDCVVAVDVPSGLSGDTGQPMGACIHAAMTVTFWRKKPGHLLWPGRQYCGTVIVRDIGISSAILAAVAGDFAENEPALWREHYPWPRADTHKYRRGHALVVCGPIDKSGAARLAARAALRAGSGLVTLLLAEDTLRSLAPSLNAVMVEACDGVSDLMTSLNDARRNAILLGPGSGVGDKTQAMVLAALSRRRLVVLDADALTAFAAYPDELFGAIESPCVLTPHEGEFQKLFPDLSGDRVSRVQRAAERSHAIVLLKGPDTVVASPDGRVSINAHASPWLATAGSGDVLAGLVLGLAAQGMPPFEAASAAVWLHGDLGLRLGPGLIADDLPDALPATLRQLQSGWP